MSSPMSSIAPQTVAWEPSRGLVPVSNRVVGQARVDQAHELPLAANVPLAQVHSATIVRQRFYPAQLRYLVGGDLLKLATARKHRLLWAGWDRSLPRMYLPVEQLSRLLLEAVDGITRQVSPVNSLATIKLRVACEPAGGSTLVLALDADRWECDAQFRGALNAYWFRQSSQAHLWQRLARQCDSVGGWLSVADLPGGGASLLINLPTDQPRALVHSWLNSQLSRHTVSSNIVCQRKAISLVAIGRSQPESMEELQAANIRLQSLARPTDYIYRVSHGRWLWLTTEETLPTFLHTAAWQIQRLDRWSCTGEPAALVDMAQRLDGRFRELIGTRVAPLDLRTQAVSRGPITKNLPDTRVDQPSQVSPASHLQSRVEAKARSSKWRYPI